MLLRVDGGAALETVVGYPDEERLSWPVVAGKVGYIPAVEG